MQYARYGGRPPKPTTKKVAPSKRWAKGRAPIQNKYTPSVLQKQELKVFDTAVSFTCDATGEVPATGQLCFIQTGDTLNNRDGAVIHVKSLQIRGLAGFVPAAAPTAATVAYIYVVQDRQANGAAAAITDVLTSNNMAIAVGNVPNQYRFKILKRIVMPLISPAGVTTAYNNVVCPIDEYIKFPKPLELRYTASAGAITDIASNNIFLLAGTDGGSDDTVSVLATARLRFTG